MRRSFLVRLTAIGFTVLVSVPFSARPAMATDKPRVDLYLHDGRSRKTQPCVREEGEKGYVQYWCRTIVPASVGFPASEALAFEYARYGDTKDAPKRHRDINGNNYTVFARGTLWEACHHFERDDHWECNARAEDAKVYLFETDAWDYYLGAMRSWAQQQGDVSYRAVSCVAAIYSAAKFGPNGSEWNSCTGG